MPAARKKVKVSWSDLETAMTENLDEGFFVFDAESGQASVIFEYDRLLRSHREDLEDWEQEMWDMVHGLEAGDPRFLAVPTLTSDESWEDMAAFVETLDDEELRDRFSRNIRGRGAFRRFRELLLESNLREAWEHFQSRLLRQRIVGWLQEQGLEPQELPLPEPAPDPRTTGEPELRAVAKRYEALAETLEQAAAHCRTAAGHVRAAETARAADHAFSAQGRLAAAGRELEDLAMRHARRSK